MTTSLLCPNCGREDYSKYKADENCVECGAEVCRMCSHKIKPNPRKCHIHPEYETSKRKNIQTNISRKIQAMKNFDKKRFGHYGNVTIEHIIELKEKQDGKCLVCKDKLLFTKYAGFCFYQYSIDRIDNYKPHDIGNLVLTCYYCNCRITFKDDPYKRCKKRCHIHKRRLKLRAEVIPTFVKIHSSCRLAAVKTKCFTSAAVAASGAIEEQGSMGEIESSLK